MKSAKLHLRSVRPGFSFTEILFAIMILGIGFIMIAAIFPVSLTQTRATSDETAAAALARNAVNVIEQFASSRNIEATENIVVVADYDPTPGDAAYGGSLWDAIQQSVIPPSDSRYAWVPLYRRGGTQASPATYAQLILIPVVSRGGSTYVSPPEIERIYTGADRGKPFISGVRITNGADPDPDTITFSTAPAAAVEGAYVVVADATAPNGAKFFNGRVYRLLRSISTDQTVWELEAGNDFTPEWVNTDDNLNTSAGGRADGADALVTEITSAKVFVIGRRTDVASDAGNAENIAAYTTFIAVK